VAAAYAVAAWLLVQAASIVLPTFGAPVWALKAIVVAAVILFPLVLWMAWEMSPAPLPHQVFGAGKFKTGEIALLSLLGIVVVLSLVQIVASLSRTDTAVAVQATPEQAAGANSVAVLPFENLSSEKDTGYFAAGIQDEILTRLSKIRSLRVISRTSTQRYASRPDDLRQIGRSLDVANILEGSVQRVGDRVRVNVQLIHAASDDHVWAEIYDRKLDDVFQVETDVASAIANALAAAITPSERKAIAVRPTENQQAYDSYLRGLALFYLNDDEHREQAIGYFNDAVRLDPKFAQAWALLARLHAFAYFGSDATEQRHAAVMSALNHALVLQPQSPEVLLAQGFVTYYVQRDYHAALRQFQDVQSRWPSNADALYAMGVISRRLGLWRDNEAYLRKSIAIDPGQQVSWMGLAVSLELRRKLSDSIAVLETALNKWPNDIRFLSEKAYVQLGMGDVDGAAATLKDVHPSATDGDALGAYDELYRERRQFSLGAQFFSGLLAVAQSQKLSDLELAGLHMQTAEFQSQAGDAKASAENNAKAFALIEPLTVKQPNSLDAIFSLCSILTDLDERQKALACWDRLSARLPASEDALDGVNYENYRAWALAHFGDRERAIPALARLLKMAADLTPAMLRLDPEFDPLRGDPRFEALANSQPVEIN
jgi:TolB-like protein